MTEPLEPSEGLGVLHLFCAAGPSAEAEAVRTAVKGAEEAGLQVVTFAVLGHKADLGFMALGPDLWRLRALQTDLVAAGLARCPTTPPTCRRSRSAPACTPTCRRRA